MRRCKIDLAVFYSIHPTETVLARFRNDEIVFSDIIEAILLGIDRLELAAEGLSSNK